MPEHHQTCPLCEAMCGLTLTVEDGEIRKIRGDREDPFSQGHICPKGVALQDLHTDPDRLRTPLVKRNGSFESIGWDEALDLVAERLRAVQIEHGADSVGVYQGNPNVHNLGSMLFLREFVRSLKTKVRFSATSVDQLPHHFAALHMFGHQLLVPVPDLDRATFVLMLGTNPAASNGSMMTAGDLRGRMKGIRERGGQIVLVDPRRTESARLVDEHLFIRPETDALLLAAIAQTLFSEDRVDLGPLGDFTSGLDAFEEAVAPFTPEAIAAATGIDPDTTRRLARALADGGVAYGRMGCSTQSFGALCQWLINGINVLTGALDRPGGAMFTTPAIDVLIDPNGRPRRGGFGRWRSRVRGLPEFGGELPVSVLAEEIRTPGEGQMRALVTVAGNPVLSTPDGDGLAGALEQLDFMVCIDPYLNETTCHADVILPPASPLERPHYDLIFNILAVRNTAKWSPALYERPDTSRHDWEIFAALEDRLLPEEGPARGWLQTRLQLGLEGMIDFALQSAGNGLSLAALKAAPHGLDLGPLESRLPERLFTEDKTLRLAPKVYLADLPRLRASQDTERPELVLIGRRDLRSNNSWMHNSERLVRGKERCTLLVHPGDAARLSLEDGADATVTSATGAVVVAVEVTDAIAPGVVSLPHGWGHGRDGVRLSTASAHPGVSHNTLTDPSRVDPVCGNAAFSGTPVEVRPA